MIEKLKIKAIYNDFVDNVTLTEEQIKILDMLLKKETIVSISMQIGTSQRTIGYEIRKIKNLYDNYRKMQLKQALQNAMR